MTDWTATYRPWAAIEVAPVPVPYARRHGVPVSHVEMPGPVAAADAQGIITTCQLVAAMRVKTAKVIMARRRFDSLWEHCAGKEYEPGLLRLVCPQCGDASDAWVGDDGRLQDPRDLVCARTHDPAVMVRVVDGAA